MTCARKTSKFANKNEDAELSLLVADVIKSGYNPDEINGETRSRRSRAQDTTLRDIAEYKTGGGKRYHGIAEYRNPEG